MAHASATVSAIGASLKNGVTLREENTRIVMATAAATMNARAKVCLATIPADGTYVIKLPLAQECPGELVLVYVVATSGGTSVTVDTQVAAEFAPTGALTAVGDFCLVISTGTTWIELLELST